MDLSQSDSKLVKRFRAGDDRAFDILCIKYFRYLMSIFVRLGHDEHAAEDLIQETFLCVYVRINSFEDRGDNSFRKWLCKIGTGCSCDRWRKQSRDQELRKSVSPVKSSISSEPNLLAILEENEIKQELQNVLKNILKRSPKLNRELFHGRYYMDMTLTKLAAIHNISRSKVTRRIKYVFRLLEKELKEKND